MAIKFKAPIQIMGLYWERSDRDLGTYGWRRRSVRIVGVVVEKYIGMRDVIVVVWPYKSRILAP